ncbi:MAG: hypothetical protein JO036_06050 [Candidatus Eremiobacteraeota bacterium]|nr:hypothetical protein [Candidatus Eremiobacteraeota bacterium]
MKSQRGGSAVKTPRRRRGQNAFAKTVAWIVLAIFVLTSVGVILIVR